MRNFDGFNFNTYLKNYLDKNGIKSVRVSEILELPYQTFRSKLSRDTFTYQEVLFLDQFYVDLNYLDNYKKYLHIRNQNL